jgi:mitochondrial fission protein ELM1
VAYPLCWVITDGKAGLENPCIAVAERLGLTPVVKRVRLRSPWKQLSPWALRFGNRWALDSSGDMLDGPLPDLLIATGRASVAPAMALKRMTGGKCLRVQLQSPGVAPGNFDLVVVPRHDRLRGANVMVTKGSPHSVTPALLTQAFDHFSGRLGHLGHPRIAVLLGGSNSVYKFTELAAVNLAECLSTLVRGTGASVMLTASRRTAPKIKEILRNKLAGLPGEVWDETGENPY